MSSSDRTPGWESDAPRLEALEQLLSSSDGIARAGSEDGSGAFSMVMTARLTPSSERIVVLDRAPPFLKVFDQTGSFISSGIQRNGGLEELRVPGTIAVTDSLTAIAGPEGLAIASLEGELLRKPTLPLQLLDVGFDCQGRLLAYGPGSSKPRHFVHTLRLEPDISIVTSAFEDSAIRPLSWGHGRSAVVGSGNGSLIAHKTEGGVNLLFVDCHGEIGARPWSWAVTDFPSQHRNPTIHEQVSGNLRSFVIDATVPMFIGAAELPGERLLWTERRLVPTKPRPAGAGDIAPRTYFHVVDSLGLYRGYIPGWFMLQDVEGGSLVLSVSDPWPQVLVIPIPTFIQLVSKGQWIDRRPGS